MNNGGAFPVKMMTEEKLFVQIFERKNSIIEQVKKQTDLYIQHLVSKLLIDGITPPPWLWNPSQSSNLNELNKDELISEILLPRAWPSTYYPSARYSICNRTVVTGDNGELSNAAFLETNASSKDLYAREGPSSGAVCHDNYNEDVLYSIPELGVKVTFPQDEPDTRTESTLDAPDKSLAKIQRSKSRQKALELRNSTNAKTKSRSSNKYKYDVTSIGIDFSASVSEQVNESHIFPDPSVPVSGNHGLPAERNCPEQENLVDNYTGRVTRSISCSIKRNHMSDNCNADSYSDIAENVMSIQKNKHAIASTGMHMSMLPFEQENLVSKSLKISEPCIISTENYAVRESSEGDRQNLEKGVDVYTEGDTRSRSSAKHQNCVYDSFEVNNASCTAKKNNGGQAHSIADLLNQSVVVVNSSDIAAESHNVCNAKVRGYTCQKKEITGVYSKRLTRSMSSITTGTLQVDASTYSTNKNANIISQTSRETMGRLVETKRHLELVQPSIGLDNRSSNPQCHSCNEVITNLAKLSSIAGARDSGTKSSALQKSCENQDIQNASHDNVILKGPGKCDADNQLGNAEADSSKPRIPRSNHSETNGRMGMECLTAKMPSDCFMLMKPKQLDFDDVEECNLNGNTYCTSEYENLDIANKEMGCTPLHHFSLKNKVPSSSHIIISEKQSTPEQDIYSKLSSCPVEFTIQEPARSKIYASDREVNASKSWSDDPEALQCFRNSNFPPEEDNMLPSGFNTSDAKHQHTKLSPRERSDSLIKPYVEVGVSGFRRHGEGIAASCSSKSKNFVTSCIRRSTRSTGNYHKCLAKEVANEDPTTSSSNAGGQNHIRGARCDDTNSSLLESNEIQFAMDSSMLEKKFRSAKANSWLQVKRRKLDGQQADCFSASRNSQMPKLCKIKMAPGCIDLHNIEGQSKSVSKEASYGDSNTSELCPIIDCHVPERLGLSLIASNDCLVEEIGRGDLGGSMLIDETGKEVPAGPNLDARQYSEEQENALKHENNVGLANNEGINLTGNIVLKRNSHMVEEDPFLQPFVHSSHDEVQSTGIDDTMPVFEGFIVDPLGADGELGVSGVNINFEALDLPRSTIERASILEQICRSASMQEPLSKLSSALKSHRSDTLYQSLPKGLLEHMDFRSTSLLSEDIDEQFRSCNSCAEEVRDTVQGISYSDCLGYSGAKFRWKSESPYASPVGKLWERSSSHSGSSGTQLSSNPELTCFPIKEDPTISEENENVDKLANEVQDDINSIVENSDAERQPLFEITKACLNPPASVSAAEKVQAGGIMDSAKSDAGFSGTQNKSKRELPSRCRNISVGKENQALLISAAGNKKEKHSHANGYRKPNLSATTSLRRNDQKLTEKGYNRHNNIISNVTSFVPLVQQKQAATVYAGKKDIKVKALEAAEAAKRLEEKKEIERKKRKEAVKLERARLEQENMKQLELNKQKKEEERKKKDAEVLARKRLRAEEEKNDKEKRRKRIEEVRRQHNEQEEKLRAKKVEIDKKFSAADEKAINMKESDDKLNICHVEKKIGDIKASTKPVSETGQAGILKTDHSGATISYERLDNSVDHCQHGKVIHANFDKPGKDQNFTAMETQSKSYEISPYKCSDDEDEDEDEEDQPMQKFVPSWASKSCVALVLPLQQEIDPDFIFPTESFCSMDEVLLPRKLKQKHAVV